MPRTFAAGEDPGYHNATLGTTGVALPFPVASYGAVISVSAGCFLGFRNSDTLDTFDDAHYGSISSGLPHTFQRGRDGGQTHIHIAPWGSTAIVSIMFL